MVKVLIVTHKTWSACQLKIQEMQSHNKKHSGVTNKMYESLKIFFQYYSFDEGVE